MTAHRADRADMVMDAIVDFMARYGHGPTVQEVATVTGLSSKGTVFYHLHRLERQGDVGRCPCGCRRYVPVTL